MIKILIVNDSVMVQQLLKRIIDLDAALCVAGVAGDGEEAIRLTQVHEPDVILMDIRMPVMNGVDATREIMAASPRPILIVTATIRAHMPYIYDCLSLGALEVVKTPMRKPDRTGLPEKAELQEIGAELLSRIHIASNLRRAIEHLKPKHKPHEKETRAFARPDGLMTGIFARKILAIGASTGGPNAIRDILKMLPKNINAGIILVQHINADFAAGLAEWFAATTLRKVFSAMHGDMITQNTAYLAAEAKHLKVTPDGQLKYEESKPGEIHVPSIDATFESLAEVYGRNAVGVLLTGMGADGARGLLAMRKAGARTIAQDEETSLIYGMPKAAKEMKASEFVLPIYKIAAKITELLEE
jgi:chemotaxis response regulator CheB